MKKIVLVFLMLLPTFAWADPNPADYTINVHVSSSRMDIDYEGKVTLFYRKLDVTIDGKKFELEADRSGGPILALGDYKARLVQDEHKSSYEFWQTYEFLFPDKKTAKFRVVGLTE